MVRPVAQAVAHQVADRRFAQQAPRLEAHAVEIETAQLQLQRVLETTRRSEGSSVARAFSNVVLAGDQQVAVGPEDGRHLVDHRGGEREPICSNSFDAEGPAAESGEW